MPPENTDYIVPALIAVSLAYQLPGALPQQHHLRDLTHDDLVHVLTSLQARQRTRGQARTATTAVLNQVRTAYYDKALEDVTEVVEQVLDGWRETPNHVRERLIAGVMDKVGATRPDWAAELYDTHLRNIILNDRLRVLEGRLNTITVSQPEPETAKPGPPAAEQDTVTAAEAQGSLA